MGDKPLSDLVSDSSSEIALNDDDRTLERAALREAEMQEQAVLASLDLDL
jgi:hypothetical protein